jgi:hypothetical protein
MYILDIPHSEMSGSSRSTAVAIMIWIKIKHKESTCGIVGVNSKFTFVNF